MSFKPTKHELERVRGLAARCECDLTTASMMRKQNATVFLERAAGHSRSAFAIAKRIAERSKES